MTKKYDFNEKIQRQQSKMKAKEKQHTQKISNEMKIRPSVCAQFSKASNETK